MGRYNFNIDFIKKDKKNFVILPEDKIRYNKEENLKIEFKSVHKSKGLQADYVIITHCNGGKYGFPTELSDDPILKLVVSSVDTFENGEERRLFYVALSRAKEKVFILSDQRFESKFVTELKGGSEDVKKCPRCESGYLIPRRTLLGCSNFYYGCSYSTFL